MRMEKLIEKFIGYDCKVSLGKEFAYFPAKKVITFTYNEPIKANTEWKKFLKETFNFNLTNENLFSMSVLHELGHHYTEKLFSNEEWIEQTSGKYFENLDGSELYQTYYNMPIEKIATEWAVMVYNANLLNMRVWNHRFNCALRHWQKLRKKKTSFLTKF